MTFGSFRNYFVGEDGNFEFMPIVIVNFLILFFI